MSQTSRHTLAWLVGIGVIAAMGVAPVAAGQESRPDSKPAEPVVHAFLSIGLSHNFNAPSDRRNQLRVFDFDDHRVKVDAAELVVQRPADGPGQLGFRADFVAGGSIPRVSAASGLFRNRTTGEVRPEDVDLQQVYVSYMAPLGSGLRIDTGKFVTHAGAEVIDGYDGFNDHYTRSFLFGFAQPATHTGVRATYAFNGTVAGTLLVVNGWDNFRDNNSGKSVGAQIAVTPSKAVAIYANYLGGPEGAARADLRHLYDIVGVLKPREGLTVTLNYDYAREAKAAGLGRPATWYGLAGSSRFELSERYSLSIRGERFADANGTRTGTAQTLHAATVTPALRLTRALVGRVDLRLDHSSAMVFERRGRFTDTQVTMAVNGVIAF